jgi:hypothetical protein
MLTNTYLSIMLTIHCSHSHVHKIASFIMMILERDLEEEWMEKLFLKKFNDGYS